MPANSGFDKKIAEQLTINALAYAQHSLRMDDVLGRNVVQSGANVLTLGVQLNHAASLKQLTSIDPMEAASAANIGLSAAGMPAHIASLQTAAKAPGGV